MTLDPVGEREGELGVQPGLATLDQRRASLDPEATVTDILTGGRSDTVVVNGEARHIVTYMKDFLFRPEQARTPLKALSGGERGRLMLARALAQPSNLLVLDEPTNDLDLETLDLLQEMLATYPGTLLLVSHDRDFLDRVVTSVLASEGDGVWTEYAGGYSDMVAQRRGNSARPAAPGGGGRPAARPSARSASREVATPSAAPANAVRRESRRRITFADQHALKTLPTKIAGLAAEVRRLEEALSDPTLYGRDAKTFAALSSALEAARIELGRCEDEWLHAELRREEIEGK